MLIYVHSLASTAERTARMVVGARLGKTLPSPYRSLDKLNLPLRAAARLAGAARCVHRATPLPAGATRRRSCQLKARSQQVGCPADKPAPSRRPLWGPPPARTVAGVLPRAHVGSFAPSLILISAFALLVCFPLSYPLLCPFVCSSCLLCVAVFRFILLFLTILLLDEVAGYCVSVAGLSVLLPLARIFFLAVCPVAEVPSFLVKVFFYFVLFSAERFW